MRFKIVNDQLNQRWVIYRVDGTPDQRCSTKRKRGCLTLLSLINNNAFPCSPWMQKSMRQLLTDDEFQRLKKPKDRYVNRPPAY